MQDKLSKPKVKAIWKIFKSFSSDGFVLILHENVTRFLISRACDKIQTLLNGQETKMLVFVLYN